MASDQVFHRMPWPGKGLVVMLLLLLGVESWLHSDGFLHRFRSVFAAGRAMDKVLYVTAHPPSLLILGNSRADNAFDPRILAASSHLPLPQGAFNMGIPGADSRVLDGILQRLDAAGNLGPKGIRYLVISLDEALVQKVDTLGQEVFFADPKLMWADGQYHDLLRATLRLYGYVDNFRQLREPAKLSRLVAALQYEEEPLGGGAAEHLGYRAGFGGLQDREAAMRQEAGSSAPPDPVNVRHLWRILDLMQDRGVKVAVVFPPLLNRDVLYLADDSSESRAYRDIVSQLQARGIPAIHLDDGPPRNPDEFVNAGHMNDLGAQRYSHLLGQALDRIWSTPADAPPALPSAS